MPNTHGPDNPAVGSNVAAAGAENPEKLGYQVILRHLAKLRDGARAIVQHLGTEVSGDFAPPTGTIGTEKSPLELRIERHMTHVDQALSRIRDVNPAGLARVKLSPEARRIVETQQQTIHDIVGAELHFWAAAVENAPLDRFDDAEKAWIARLVRLADRVGVDDDHRENLTFLETWISQQHS